MKTIKYNNKEYKLPFDVRLPEDPTAEVQLRIDSVVNQLQCQSLQQQYTMQSLAVKCLETMIQYVKD